MIVIRFITAIKITMRGCQSVAVDPIGDPLLGLESVKRRENLLNLKGS